MKIIITVLSITFTAFCYSQTSKPEIIKKDIPVNKNNDIIDYLPTHPSNNKTIRTKNYVYFNKKFYPYDTLSKIRNIEQYQIEIIPVPSKISKDVNGIIYIRKKE